MAEMTCVFIVFVEIIITFVCNKIVNMVWAPIAININIEIIII